MKLLLRLIIIILMALYSLKVHGEINKVKKGIQPIEKKSPKKSKSQKASEQDENEKEHPCEKEIKLCEANNV